MSDFTQIEQENFDRLLGIPGGQKVGLSYVDSKGNPSERVVQVGVNIALAHEKRGGFTGKGSWTSEAEHVGKRDRIVMNKEGRPSLRALCTMRNEMRIFRLDAISAIRHMG